MGELSGNIRECSMRRYRYLQLDVFTTVPFGGNQLAVFPQADGLSDAEMQALTREINFSETTFVLPPQDVRSVARVRIFTPGGELPMAGHPTIGTTYALAYEGMLPGEQSPVTLELGVGPLAIDVQYDSGALAFVWMHQPIPTFEAWPGDPARLLAAVGLSADDLATDLPIERGSSGVPFIYVPLRSREAVSRAQPGADLSGAAADRSPQIGVYLFSLEQGPVDAHTRMFAPGMGIVEDAASGSAAGPFGVYLVRHRRAPLDGQGEAHLRIEQGVEMGRPSDIQIVVQSDAGQPDVVCDVRIGGTAVLVAQGEYQLPS